MTAKEKVAALRAEMAKNDIEAFIVYSADPHMSEYLPEEWKERAWLSGFTGSAGFVVITKNKGGLWTDGRYFTQAGIQLPGSGIDLFKDGIEDTPNYIDWIISETADGAKVGVNALVTSHANWETVHSKLKNNNRELVNIPLLNEIWNDRPEPSKNRVFAHPDKWAGQSVSDKLNAIRKVMDEQNASVHIISALDDVAWILNLRGSDVECNPIFLSYLVIRHGDANLFVDIDKLDEETRDHLASSSVLIKPYKDFFSFLRKVRNENIMIDPNCNESVFKRIEEVNKLIVIPTPCHLMKAIKNETELEGFRTVMVRDGVAMVKFLYWLVHHAGKEPMNEYSIGEKLLNFRKEGKNFVGVSFTSIVGFKGNGAIIHYSAPEKGSAEVTNDGSILVDSGGQYLEGTTDITRTLPLGAISDEFRKNYTLVLKGHIQLGMVKFPRGTRGVQLDTLARLALWKEGEDYNHGTGHGVGSFMNVHEGPQNIRKDLNPQELLPGMVVSNEPGYYEVGQYGIRHENLVVVKPWKTTQWNDFYEFETITYCPFFKEPIIKELLSDEEIKWFNDYHQMVREKLEPYLEEKVKEWFLEMVAPL